MLSEEQKEIRDKKREKWKKDKYVVKWFSEISERTKENALEPFDKWLDFIEMSPSEQIEKRIKDLQSANPQVRTFFESKLIQWKNDLVKETDKEGKRRYSRATIRSRLQRIQSFFSHNTLGLRFARNQLSVEPSQREKVKIKWIPSNVEVRMMYKHSDVRDRALLLVLYQSGFSEIDVSMLNIENLPEIYTTDTHHYIAKLREKTNILHQTCVSLEAIHDIKVMLRERGEAKEGALFVSEKGKRLSVRFINEAIKRIAKKTFGVEKAKTFYTKNLRDAYKNGLLRAKLTTEVVDKMFGHKRSGSKEAYQLEQALIEESYEVAFRFLSINHGLQSKKDLQRVEQVVTGLSQTVAKLTTQLDEQQKQIERLLDAVAKQKAKRIEAQQT